MPDAVQSARGGTVEESAQPGAADSNALAPPRASAPAGGSPAGRPGSRRWQVRHSRASVVLSQAVIVAAFLLLWQGATGSRRGALLDELFVGKPSLIWEQTVSWLFDGTLLSNAWVTIQEGLVGFGLGSFIGISAGLILGATVVGRAL